MISLIPLLLVAQVLTNGPVTTSNKIVWRLPMDVAANEGQLLETRLYDSLTGNQSFIKLTGFTCVPPTTVDPLATCTVSMSPAVVSQLNVIGKHNLKLTFFRTDVGESPSSTPFSLIKSVDAPINPQIIQ